MISVLAKKMGQGELIECQPPGDNIWWQLYWAVTRHWLVLSGISHIYPTIFGHTKLIFCSWSVARVGQEVVLFIIDISQVHDCT